MLGHSLLRLRRYFKRFPARPHGLNGSFRPRAANSNLDEFRQILTCLRLPTNIQMQGAQFVEPRVLVGRHHVNRTGSDGVGLRKRIRIARSTVYSRSGGVTFAIQAS